MATARCTWLANAARPALGSLSDNALACRKLSVIATNSFSWSAVNALRFCTSEKSCWSGAVDENQNLVPDAIVHRDASPKLGCRNVPHSYRIIRRAGRGWRAAVFWAAHGARVSIASLRWAEG